MVHGVGTGQGLKFGWRFSGYGIRRTSPPARGLSPHLVAINDAELLLPVRIAVSIDETWQHIFGFCVLNDRMSRRGSSRRKCCFRSA
jgi:hypothetical protein